MTRRASLEILRVPGPPWQGRSGQETVLARFLVLRFARFMKPRIALRIDPESAFHLTTNRLQEATKADGSAGWKKSKISYFLRGHTQKSQRELSPRQSYDRADTNCLKMMPQQMQGLVLASPALEPVAPAGCPHVRGSLPARSCPRGRTPSPALPNSGALFLQEMVGMRSACPALEVPGSEWSHEPLLSRASSKIVQHAERKSSPHVHLLFMSVQRKLADLPRCLLHVNLRLRSQQISRDPAPDRTSQMSSTLVLWPPVLLMHVIREDPQEARLFLALASALHPSCRQLGSSRSSGRFVQSVTSASPTLAGASCSLDSGYTHRGAEACFRMQVCVLAGLQAITSNS